MTASKLLAFQLEDAGYQVEQVFNGIDESNADLMLVEGAMSPRETALHLLECCHAALAHLSGTEHKWGSLTMPEGGFSVVMDQYRAKRAEVVSLLTAPDAGDKAGKLGSEFIVLHEAYHVGQLALLRLQKTPGWDAYSIYRQG